MMGGTPPDGGFDYFTPAPRKRGIASPPPRQKWRGDFFPADTLIPTPSQGTCGLDLHVYFNDGA